MTYPANPNVDALTWMIYFHRYCRRRRGQRLWVIGHATNNLGGKTQLRPFTASQPPSGFGRSFMWLPDRLSTFEDDV